MSYKKLSLIHRFSVLCFAALVVFCLALGWLVTGALEQNMMKRAQEHTAAIVQQHIEATFSELDFDKPKTGNQYEAFARKAQDIPVGTNIKKLTFWNRDGIVIWSNDRDIVGRVFNGDEREDEALNKALGGGMVAASYKTGDELDEKHGAGSNFRSTSMLEMYVPITYGDLCEVFGAVEVYEDAEPLRAEIGSTRSIVWLSVSGGFSLLFMVLYGIVAKASGKIDTQSRELQDIVVGLTASLASALDAKSPWTKGHSERVGMYTERIALKMGLPESEIGNLRLAGLLHDIGKIGTYDYLLEKPERLTAEEFELVKKHPEQGARILSEIKQMEDIVPIIEHHHERYDGGGYPNGLAGEEIPVGARILHVADSFEAITDDRPYRRARDYRTAVRELLRHSGTQFDPDVVRAFIDVLDELHGVKVKEKSFGYVDFPGPR